MSVPLTLKVFKGDAMVAAKDYDRDIIKIGRLATAHLCLDDDKVSRIHSGFAAGHLVADLEALRQQVEAGHVTPIVGKTYPLPEVPEAIRHLEDGRAQGKIAITV